MAINWATKRIGGKVNWAPKFADHEPGDSWATVTLAGTEISTPFGFASALGGEIVVPVSSVAISIAEHSPPFGSASVVADRTVSIVSITGTERSPPSGSAIARAFTAPDITEDEARRLARGRTQVRRIDDPEAIIAFDFRAQLAKGESITSMKVVSTTPGFEQDESAPRRILLGPPGLAGRLVAQWIGGGTEGVRYHIVCTVETSHGQRLERSLTVRVLGKWRTSRRVV